MAEVSKKEYVDVVMQVASDVADEKVKQYLRHHKAVSVDDQESMRRKYFQEYKRRLEKSYPYENVDKDKVNAISSYDTGKMLEWLDQYGSPYQTALSPIDYQKTIKAADILPLLQGVAKPGHDWMTMGEAKLKDFGIDHGYDVKSKEGFASLLNDIGEQQVNYDRAQIAKEAKDSLGVTYWPRKIIAPSAMQEFENAIMTGGDYDAWDAAKMGALDAGVNTLMWEAPGFKFTNSNIANGVLGAATQAGAEAGRQGLEVGLSKNGQEFDLAPVVFAGGAGATRPVIIGTAQGAAARLPGENWAQFSRGIGKALKTGDPAAREAEQLTKSVLEYNKNVAKHNTLVEETASTLKEFVKQSFDQSIAKKGIAPDPERYQQAIKILDESTAKAANAVKPIMTSRSIEPLAKVERAIAASKVPEKAKALGVTPESDGTYSAAKILEAYNKPLYAQQAITGGTARFGSPNYVTKTFREPVRVLDNESVYEFRQMFPAKYSDEAALNGWTTAGLGAGKVLGAFGSRAEPTFKLKGDKMGVEKTYKDEGWYEKLTPRSKKVIDEAFKKKAEEESEE